MGNYLVEQVQKYFDTPIYLEEPPKSIDIVDKDGELLGVLEDMGGDYQLRVNGIYITMIEKSSAMATEG